MTRADRIRAALQAGPLTLDELRAALPDVSATVISSTLFGLKRQGYVEVEPVRYRLAPEPEATKTYREAVRRQRADWGERLTLDDLPEAERGRLGQDSDSAIAQRTGLNRMKIRALRMSLGIEAVSRGSRRR